MKKYQPILLERLQVRVGSWRVRQFSLHHHLPETDSVRDHAHPYSQLLLYLTGHGKQRVKGTSYPVGPGTLFLIPRRVEHSFVRVAARRPLCVVMDFDWRDSRQSQLKTASIHGAELSRVRHLLAEFGQWHRHAEAGDSLPASVFILRLLDVLLRASGALPSRRISMTSPLVQKLAKVLDEGKEKNLKELATKAGYQQDHLNRLLRGQVGMTLGQFRSTRRLQEAKHQLQIQTSVGAAAEAVGFEDPNYFTRWFRQQTGVSPRTWLSNRVP